MNDSQLIKLALNRKDFMRKYRSVVIAGILSVCLTNATAQINPSTLLPGTSQGVTSTNFFFARPNELTIIVDIVGFVNRPGRYEIASSIDLVNLVSLAGGPTPDGNLSTVNIIRMFGKGDSTVRKEFQINLFDLPAVKQEELRLMPGDLVLVDRTNWAAFRDNFGVISSVATLTLIIAQFFR